jgi:cardiolipin synthase
MKKEDFRIEKIFTIPNILTIFRLFLAFAFWYQYTHAITPSEYTMSGLLLVISGITDILDGKIARRFNMVSELGKMLDPIADKVTQFMIMLCLVQRFPLILFELVLFVIKQLYLSFAGLYIIKKTGRNLGARWYGKLNTILLYACSIILILPLRISTIYGNILIEICCISIVFTLISYIKEYAKILKVESNSASFLKR